MFIKKNVCIFSFIGSENMGDEAIFCAVIKEVSPKVEHISIISFNINNTKKILENFKNKNFNIYNSSIVSSIKAILNSQIFVCGGGGIIQDQTSIFNIPFFFSRIIIAKLLRKKIFFYAIGVGPLQYKISRVLVKMIMNTSVGITVRDKQSKELLEKIGVDKANIKVTADPATSLDDLLSEYDAKDLLIKNNLNLDKKIIVVCLRDYFSHYALLPASIVRRLNFRTKKDKQKHLSFITKISQTLEYLQNKDYQILFLPFYNKVDNKIHKEVIDLIKVKKNIFLFSDVYSLQQIYGVIKYADVALCMRFHSLIFSFMNKIPFVAIDYSSKVYNFIDRVIEPRDNKDNFFINPKNFQAKELIAKIDYVSSININYDNKLDLLKKEESANFVYLYKKSK
ncbi:hypothetical protein HON36_00205 [Candidatus Parcubacteria bacterium]|jgi:polysaccharide pyruvyl transferase CsaB|nr:hypothetical protein [Candidatus Parcubacteria bacterium]